MGQPPLCPPPPPGQVLPGHSCDAAPVGAGCTAEGPALAFPTPLAPSASISPTEHCSHGWPSPLRLASFPLCFPLRRGRSHALLPRVEHFLLFQGLGGGQGFRGTPGPQAAAPGCSRSATFRTGAALQVRTRRNQELLKDPKAAPLAEESTFS